MNGRQFDSRFYAVLFGYETQSLLEDRRRPKFRTRIVKRARPLRVQARTAVVDKLSRRLEISTLSLEKEVMKAVPALQVKGMTTNNIAAEPFGL